MPTKQQLHDMVDRLPDESTDAALRVLAGLAADPALYSLLIAPLDDEPYTEEQQREDAEAIAALERGEGIPHEEILKEFGVHDPSH
jgi:hypothetical protein